MTPKMKLPDWPIAAHRSGEFPWLLFYRVLLCLVTAALLTICIFPHLDFYRVGSSLDQFRVDQPVPRDIQATTEIRWEDDEETTRLRDSAEKAVTSEFIADTTALPRALKDVDEIFSPVKTGKDSPAKPAPELSAELAQLDKATRESLYSKAVEILTAAMAQRVEEGKEEVAAQQLIDPLVIEREKLENNARLLKMVTRAAFHATWVKDTAATDVAKILARDAVSPVYRIYKPGDVILRKGVTLSESSLRQLQQNRLLLSGTYTLVVPLAMIILLGVIFFGVYLRVFTRSVYDSSQKLTLLAILLVASVWAATAFSVGEQQYLLALIAVPAGCMVVAGLLGGLVAVPAAVLTALAASFPADHQFAIFLLTLGSALAGIIMVSFIWPARSTVLAALALIVINLLLLTVVPSIIPSGNSSLFIWSDIGTRTLWATAGGLGAIFIAVGAIYMLARPFGILTHYRLMELSNPNEPILRRMMLEAPGSYHSSVMVANMAEAAADAIGVDSLLTRVAALYHDIGKLKRPTFFVENQAPLGIENVHEKLTPKMSYLILSNHVRDGVETARENQLPEEVVQIISEHHGTTLAAYFYHRALTEANGDPVPEYEYRYPGPKPATREAALVMLSDSVQASVKSIQQPNAQRIADMVNDIIQNRLEDGQLDDCPITRRDLRLVSEVFLRILTGLYSYTRIEYPDMKDRKIGERTQARANTNQQTTLDAGDTEEAAPGD